MDSLKKTEKTACILCSRNCGLVVEIENDNFTRIRGDEDHPVSKGYICQKAARLQYYQQNADRVSPIVHSVPVQLLAYHTALARGTDVDKPRNLAKSVTVE